MRIWIVLVICSKIFFCNALSAQSVNNFKHQYSLINSFAFVKIADNKNIPVYISNSNKLQLFIFLSPECPISKNYIPSLNKLFLQYNKQIEFYGCISGKGFSDDEITSFNKTYKILFPLIIDKEKKFTNYIDATVTPEVVLTDNKNELIYKGAIDDWMEDLGKQKLNISKHYLQDAISAYLFNKPVAIKQTKAYGCLINDY